MLMSHLEEPKVTEDEEPPTEQDKRKKDSWEVRGTILCMLFRANKVLPTDNDN